METNIVAQKRATMAKVGAGGVTFFARPPSLFQPAALPFDSLSPPLSSCISCYDVQVPDIKRALDALALLIKKKEDGESFTTNYELADNIYARAVVKEPSTVYLWLGVRNARCFCVVVVCCRYMTQIAQIEWRYA